ncbi:MAG: NAD(P)-binding protein [Anaerolineae bacterium]
MARTIVVVGAGIGGLSAAIRLAAWGQRVVVVEKNAQVGGKMNEISADGFRWDTGPSVITMRPVFEDLFAAAGRKLDDYLTLLPVEPLTRYFYPDGTQIDASRNPEVMAAQIAKLDAGDVEGYHAYLRYAERIHRITGPVFIYDQPPTTASFLRVPVADWFRVDALRTMQQAIEGYVKSPQLRQLDASRRMSAAARLRLGDAERDRGRGVKQRRMVSAGGIYTIARALERLAREQALR